MASNKDLQNVGLLTALQSQLSLARTEINNLRKELKSLKHAQSREISNIKAAVDRWTCSKCSVSDTSNVLTENGSVSGTQEGSVQLQPIGFISTGFVKKRAVPRQPNMNLSSHGRITLFDHVFTNPEHSLEGLDGFSHMWILFHFHKNESNHIRAKVAPPRLNGARVGVFGTRSPHRPCPIGLSLVQIDKIEGSSIHFSGVDMVDNTPVLDLKPYIPHYDNPSELSMMGLDSTSMERLELDGQESDPDTAGLPTPKAASLLRPPETFGPSQREAPDGEEGEMEVASPRATLYLRSNSPLPAHRHVRVPEWISQTTPQLHVTFTPQAECVLSSLGTEENITRIITDILREDPRSVYLRDRYANQFYTFLINNFHVSCKFDDNQHSVKVFRVVAAGTVCECGLPEWQCSSHSGGGGGTDT